ncbi:MAG: thiamine pyrophosphate-dependent enzyme [Rhabdochlamydiaceae bacterium]
MSKNVADVLWKMLEDAGVKRCYGIVGDALNPVIDALHRNGKIEFIHVRHEEFGTFAAVADAYLTGQPVAVCGTAGPGVTHLINGLIDAHKEGAPIIAICGDIETSLMDTCAFEELNPYQFFEVASLYTGRIVCPEQVRAVVQTAIRTSILEGGPTVISIPGNVAVANAPSESYAMKIPKIPKLRPLDEDIDLAAGLINGAKTVAIFGGEGCRESRELVLALAKKINAPIGYSFRGKQWLEYDNPYAVGMTGFIGYGGAYDAINQAEVLLLLGTDFPFSEFLPKEKVKKIQIDKNPKHIGRRTNVDIGLVGDVNATLSSLVEKIDVKKDTQFLEKHLIETKKFSDRIGHYVTKGPAIKPIRPEYLIASLNAIAADDAIFFADTGTACIWAARYIMGSKNRRLFGSFSWGSMANAAPNAFGAQLAFPGRQTIAISGDGGFTMLALGDLLTQVQRKLPIVHIILNNSSLGFVHIEMEEFGMEPYGVDFQTPNFAKVAEAMGAKGIRLENPADVKQGLEEALAYKKGPVVIDAVVDPRALSIPSHIPFHTAKGFTLSFIKQALKGKMDDVIETIEHNVDLL